MTNAIEKKGAAGLAQYGNFDLETMEEVEKQLPQSAGGFFKPKGGKNIIRFMPPLQGRPAVKVWYKHFFSAGGEKKAIVCTKYQLNEPCPLCEKGARLRSSGRPPDMKKARAFDPTSHVYANIVDMKNPEKGVQVWQIPQGLWKKIRKAVDVSEVGKTFTHPEKGFNIIVNREGEGMKTEYDPVTVARESTPLPDWEQLLATQLDLENIETLPGDEEQEEALEGEFEVKGGDDKRSSRGRDTSSSRSSKKEEPEDADIDY